MFLRCFSRIIIRGRDVFAMFSQESSFEIEMFLRCFSKNHHSSICCSKTSQNVRGSESQTFCDVLRCFVMFLRCFFVSRCFAMNCDVLRCFFLSLMRNPRFSRFSISTNVRVLDTKTLLSTKLLKCAKGIGHFHQIPFAAQRRGGLGRKQQKGRTDA